MLWCVQGLLKETQLANDRLQKEYNLLTDKVSKVQHTLEEHIQTNTQVRASQWLVPGTHGMHCWRLDFACTFGKDSDWPKGY